MRTGNLSVIWLAVALLLFPLHAHADIPEQFSDLLERAGLQFTVPEGYIETIPDDNPHMQYEYAIKHPDEKFEIRYAVRPWDGLMEHYREFQENPHQGSVMTHPNNLFPAAAIAVMHNCSVERQQVTQFPDDAVKAEFNADMGVVVTFAPRPSFAEGYEACVMTAIFKRDLGTGYVFFLADDPIVLIQQMVPVFHALKFL